LSGNTGQENVSARLRRLDIVRDGQSTAGGLNEERRDWALDFISLSFSPFRLADRPRIIVVSLLQIGAADIGKGEEEEM
jgi:hypothetical protein